MPKLAALEKNSNLVLKIILLLAVIIILLQAYTLYLLDSKNSMMNGIIDDLPQKYMMSK